MPMTAKTHEIRAECVPENTIPRTALSQPQTSIMVRTVRQMDTQLGIVSAPPSSTSLNATTCTYQMLLTGISPKVMIQPHGFGRTKLTRIGMNPYVMKTVDPTHGPTLCSQMRWDGRQLTTVIAPHALSKNPAASQLWKADPNRPSYQMLEQS